MRVSKLNLQSGKRKVMRADELMAYKQAYERPLAKRDYLFLVMMPAVILASLTFYLTYNWLLLIIAVIIGALYGRYFLMPKSIFREYQINALRERNRLLNMITQIMSDPKKNPPEILKRATLFLKGELKEDFLPILWKVTNNATNEEIHHEFQKIGDKYNSDLIFNQFLEQLETNFTMGVDNRLSLQDLGHYHNQLMNKRQAFLNYKMKQKRDFFSLSLVILMLITALEFAFSHQAFLACFVGSIIGTVTSTVYLIISMLLFHKFCVNYYDDVITEGKVK